MKSKQPINIIFYGVGGQGVLKASEIVGLVALHEGYQVKKTEVHGMAQRGGSVESHLRFGHEVFSPVIPYPEADYLVCLYREEHPRFKDYARPGGVDLIPYLQKAEEAVGEHKKFINTFMLGVLSSYLPFKESSWFQAVEKVFSKTGLEENKKFFLEGKKLGGTL